jgi:hypothetical protein
LPRRRDRGDPVLEILEVTQSVDKLFELHDRCIASGLPEIAKAIVDTIVNRAPLETNAAGVVGRWRIEARAVLKRRAAATMAKVATGERSAAARKLRADLLEYVASAEYARACSGGVPAAKDANLFGMLLASNGRIPSVETLRKRRAA